MKIKPIPKVLPSFGSALADTGAKITAGDEQAAHIWLLLVPRLLHPVKVTIIEVLLYMEQQLSASEITALLDHPDFYLGLVDYHLKVLKEAGIQGLIESLPAGAP